jgi:hypothetical protein
MKILSGWPVSPWLRFKLNTFRINAQNIVYTLTRSALEPYTLIRTAIVRPEPGNPIVF